MDEMQFEYVSEVKYLNCVLNESGADGSGCHRKVTSGKKVAGTISSLVNVRGLQNLSVRGC